MKIEIEKMVELMNEAAEYLDKGNRIAGENLWFAVCKDMLEKIAELEKRIKELEERLVGVGNDEDF